MTSQDGPQVSFRGSVNSLKLYIRSVMYRYMCFTKIGWVFKSVTENEIIWALNLALGFLVAEQNFSYF